MTTSRLDSLYRRLLVTGFFVKGWGEPEHMRKIFNLRRQFTEREDANAFVEEIRGPVTVESERVYGGHRLMHCSFDSPCVELMDGGLLPEECRRAHFELVEPVQPRDFGKMRPVCLQYAGTGDHHFWRRRKLAALPMLQEKGITSVIIENPFYGLRKPPGQLRSSLRNVTDIFVMGACLILETLVVLRWCHDRGLGPAVLHGVSMGGHMAALSATVLTVPAGVVPCLAWTSASLTFTEGVLSGAINWPLLESQLLLNREYRQDILAMCRSERNAFRAGIDLAQDVEDRLRKEEKKGHVRGAHAFPSLREIQVTQGMAAKSVAPPSPAPANSLSGIYDSLDKILTAVNIPIGSSAPDSDGPGAGTNGDDAIDGLSKEDLRQEAFHFMRGIMDECTHLKNYPVPVDPSLCLAVAAERDAYQPRDGVRPITEVWPGARISYLEGEGHISSFLFKQKIFREAIYEVLELLTDKHYS